MKLPALKKTYQDQTVLDFPETEIPDGSITAVCGLNGSGKSTLAKILAGVIRADSQKGAAISGKVGYMGQQTFPFRLSVKNNLLQNKDKAHSKKENTERAEQLLKALKLTELSQKNAARLSGGQMQRMSLARVLMKEYDLLILDEPTASMDQEIIPAAENLMLEYQKRCGCTMILITHSPEQANRLADRIIRLENGIPLPL